MKNSFLRTILIALCVFTSIPTGFCAATYKGPELQTLPEAAQKRIKEQLHNGKIKCIEESLDNGQLVYTVEMTKGGQDRSFEVGEDGSLNRVQIALAEAPAEVQKSIRAQVGDGTLARIDKSSAEDEVTYEIEMTRNNKDRSFTLSEDGALTSIEMFIDEIPAPAQKAIRARLGSGRLGDILKEFEDGEATYSVSMTRHRKELPFTVDAEGRLVNAVVLLEDAPAAVQKAIRAKVGEGYLDQVALFVEKGKTTYEVTFTEADETDSFEVTSDGKLITTDAPDDGVPRIKA